MVERNRAEMIEYRALLSQGYRLGTLAPDEVVQTAVSRYAQRGLDVIVHSKAIKSGQLVPGHSAVFYRRRSS